MTSTGQKLLGILALIAIVGVDAVPGRLNGSHLHLSFPGSRSAIKRQLDSSIYGNQQQRQRSLSQRQQERDSSFGDFPIPDNVRLQNIENELTYDCPNCADDTFNMGAARWTMPLLKMGEKRYYLGIFFRANWYRAAQYCRYHGMHLASINSQEENDKLEKHVKDFGMGHEHFWTSGTDQAEEGHFFWMSNGRPVSFENWNTGEPNNFRYENGEEEHCLELWNRDGKGLKWNDSPCSFETYFVCEVQ